jgi:hypothetical protein
MCRVLQADRAAVLALLGKIATPRSRDGPSASRQSDWPDWVGSAPSTSGAADGRRVFGVDKHRAAAFGISTPRADDGLRLKYLVNGRWRRDLSAACTTGSGRPATAGCRNCSLQTGRSDLILNVSKMALSSPTGAPGIGHNQPPNFMGKRSHSLQCAPTDPPSAPRLETQLRNALVAGRADGAKRDREQEECGPAYVAGLEHAYFKRVPVRAK